MKKLSLLSALLLLLSTQFTFSQDLSTFSYGTFSSPAAGTFGSINISMTSSGGFETDGLRSWTSAGTLPPGFTNLPNRQANALRETSGTFSTKTVNFSSGWFTSSMLFIEDIDAGEEVVVTFKDQSGGIIPTSNFSLFQPSPGPAITTNAGNFSFVGSGNLPDPVVIIQANTPNVHSIEFQARNYSVGTNGFYFAYPASSFPSATVPTLSEWGLILLALVVLSIGTVVLWKKNYNVAT